MVCCPAKIRYPPAEEEVAPDQEDVQGPAPNDPNQDQRGPAHASAPDPKPGVGAVEAVQKNGPAHDPIKHPENDLSPVRNDPSRVRNVPNHVAKDLLHVVNVLDLNHHVRNVLVPKIGENDHDRQKNHFLALQSLRDANLHDLDLVIGKSVLGHENAIAVLAKKVKVIVEAVQSRVVRI